MPQEQKVIPLVLFRREAGQAVSAGKNAAWICVCLRALPLVGRTGEVEGMSLKTRVDCPDCGRRYFVVPDGDNRAQAIEVREV